MFRVSYINTTTLNIAHLISFCFSIRSLLFSKKQGKPYAIVATLKDTRDIACVYATLVCTYVYHGEIKISRQWNFNVDSKLRHRDRNRVSFVGIPRV